MTTQNPLLLPVILCGLASCGAASTSPATHGLRTEKVIVFKDGYALVVKRLVAKTDNLGEIHIDDVPNAAVLGSFWATTTNGTLRSMKAGWHEVNEKWTRKEAAKKHLEVLVANKGRQIQVTYQDGTEYAGLLVDVLAERTSRLEAGLKVEKLVGKSFVLRGERGDLLLAMNNLRSIAIQKMRLKYDQPVERKVRKKRLTLRFAKKGVRREVVLTYFRPGIRWIPTYRIDLVSSKAQVVMQAELLNEAEDLKDVPIDIVVGVPNFRFKDNVSPLVLESTLHRALRQAAPNLMNQAASQFGNVSFNHRSSEHQRSSSFGESVELPRELTAASKNDLFVYSLRRMDLAKGERAAIQIFSARVPFRHVYTWDVHLKKSDYANAPSSSGIVSPLTLAKNEVWHQIELQNTTSLPWTTGAAMIVEGQQPLAQELMTYTSRGDRVRVPVTISVETRGTVSEQETGRRLGALKWDGDTYARIDKQAQAKLRNNKAEAVDVEIRLRVGGRAEQADQKGRIELREHNAQDWSTYRGSPAVNNSSMITWKKRLGSGDLFEPSVQYHYFTRR